MGAWRRMEGHPCNPKCFEMLFWTRFGPEIRGSRAEAPRKPNLLLPAPSTRGWVPAAAWPSSLSLSFRLGELDTTTSLVLGNNQELKQAKRTVLLADSATKRQKRPLTCRAEGQPFCNIALPKVFPCSALLQRNAARARGYVERNLRLLPHLLHLPPRLLHRRMKNLPDCRTRAAAKEKMFECPDAQTNQISPTILHNQSQSISINAKSICRFHEELAFAEAPRKQNQLTNHPRKLKLWWRKQRGRPRGRQVRL